VLLSRRGHNHRKTIAPGNQAVLNQLEQGESLLITRHGRTIGRMEPLAAAAPAGRADELSARRASSRSRLIISA